MESSAVGLFSLALPVEASPAQSVDCLTSKISRVFKLEKQMRA